MTFNYSNVYLNETSTISGHLEKEGNYGNYFDKSYKDYYMNEKSFEKAEVKLFSESIDILLKKLDKESKDINLLIGGDLSNQISVSSYGSLKYNIPFLGVYTACATSVEQIIIASTFIDSKKINNCICTTSSHNLVSEKQFRNPVEYGAPKPKTSTFTSTGGASCYLSNVKKGVRISSSTIGKIINLNQTDVNNQGSIMAPAAADTIYNHLKNTNTKIDDYDLVLTGDLGIFGKKILKDYIKKEYNIILGSNYNDCGSMLYDFTKQKEITAGGSGPVCSCLVNYSYVFDKLKKKEFKKVLLVATGELFSPTFVYQKNSIVAIANAVCLEAL